MEQGVLSVLVNNHSGVLTRVSSLFGRKCFNIRSISAGETNNPAYTRITIVAAGNEFQLEQMRLQLEKLEDVQRVKIIPGETLAARELMMVKVQSAENGFRELAARYDAKELDNSGCGVWSVTGSTKELDEFLEAASRYGVLESCRTGVAAMETGTHTLL